MIGADRPQPVVAAAMQRVQEARRVQRIGSRIERFLQRGERSRMEHQIDLQAADIDRPHAARLQ